MEERSGGSECENARKRAAPTSLLDTPPIPTDFLTPSDVSVPHPIMMYEMPKKRVRELWQFVRLIPEAKYHTLHISQLGSEHARCAYCLKCRAEIKFEKGKHLVREHMLANHVPELYYYRHAQRAAAEAQEHNQLKNIFVDYPEPSELELPVLAGKEDQRRADDLLALWVAKSLRPFSIVEDIGFAEYIKHVNRVKGEVTVPSRQVVHDRVESKAAELRESLKVRIAAECRYFSASSDIWTSRGNCSFISFTLHYLDKGFNMTNWTLEVASLPGKHTAGSIALALSGCFERWGLNRANCTKFLRDGAANGLKACNELGVNHMSCLAHSLHLVVGAALIKKKGELAFEELIDQAESDAEVEDALGELRCEEVEEFVEESLVCRGDLDHVRGVVHKFRKLVVYFHRSSKATGRLKLLQKTANPLVTLMDTPTRWNSTLRMLARMIELRGALDDFFGYIHERDGIEEFGDAKRTLVRPTAEQWFTIQCLIDLLNNFSAATEQLSGQTYPTLVLAFPVLRAIKFRLQDETIFDGSAATVAGERFVNRTLSLMHSVRRSFISLYTERFKGLQEELLWIAYLDPRFTTMDHLTPSEVSRARQCLHDAAFQIAKEAAAPANRDAVCPPDEPREPTPKKAKQDFLRAVFGSRMRRIDPEPPTDDDETLTQRCRSEIVLYLNETATVDLRAKPLVWWRDKQSNYPILAQLARKWLGCIATSVPSERAFSTGENTVTTRRSSLNPSSVRDVLFIAENPSA